MAKKNPQIDLEVFKKSLDGKTLAELNEIEQIVVKEADTLNKELATTTFELPEENYAEVAKAIRYFLNTQSVNWQYTFGMITMYDAWPETKPATIVYPVLDQTLRTLGQMQFTGYEDWVKVNTVNDYLKPLRDKYVETTDKVFAMADKHQALMKAQDEAAQKEQLNKPLPTTSAE